MSEANSSFNWFVDESMMGIGKALAIVRPDLLYPGHHDSPVERGMKDEDWLPIVGQNGWSVLMRDKRIRRRRPEIEQLTRHGVNAFCLTSGGNKSQWEMLQLIVRHWEKIEKLSAKKGPFIYSVTSAGVRQLKIRPLQRASQ